LRIAWHFRFHSCSTECLTLQQSDGGVVEYVQGLDEEERIKGEASVTDSRGG
jgi:hypothetical protein